MQELAQEQSFEVLVQEVLALRQVVRNLEAGLGVDKTPKFVMRTQETAGMSVTDIIAKCLAEKRVINFQSASLSAVGSQFRPWNRERITDLFATTVPGSDALIVNKAGQHAEKVAARHHLWLKLHGFEQMPTIK